MFRTTCMMHNGMETANYTVRVFVLYKKNTFLIHHIMGIVKKHIYFLK